MNGAVPDLSFAGGCVGQAVEHCRAVVGGIGCLLDQPMVEPLRGGLRLLLDCDAVESSAGMRGLTSGKEEAHVVAHVRR